jgi:1-phosphofructokinase
MKIITVTMNPAADKTAEAGAIAVDGLNRLENVILDAGGKGVNVSRTIAALGGESIATGFLGGSAGVEIERALQIPRIKTDFVKIRHSTRTNLKIVGGDGAVTEFNEPGAAVSPDESDALREKLLEYANPDAMFVFAGSLPRGSYAGVYGTLITAVKAKGASAFLDADGEAFRLAVNAGPDYIKPNRFELAQYFRLSALPDRVECADLCRRLIASGIGLVALSLGAEGAMFVTKTEELYAPGLPVTVLSPVGAGDSMVGALAYGFGAGMGLRDAAALSVAASAGAVATRGTKPPDRAGVDGLLKQVRFEPLQTGAAVIYRDIMPMLR